VVSILVTEGWPVGAGVTSRGMNMDGDFEIGKSVTGMSRLTRSGQRF
jgi:hypothetical protein